ncbi:beta-propeller fold lactonase family protein [Kibdelosporangium banguiense]|uniref:beta-propeller fold lactonase family protein n=1 Tax=Kibdelosporangium banguiense TaxID=1365924 RepID=UPI001AE61ADD|nr:beta-propeller fold lactonase family protein [Kibdelosporangium banguiense]
MIWTSTAVPTAAADEPGNRQIYVTNILSDNISTFDIAADGRLVRRAELVTTDAAPRSIVVTPDGRFAYTANGVKPMTPDDSNSISMFRIAPGGQLVPLRDPVKANKDPDALAVAPNGRTLYVVNRGTDTVLAFRIGGDGRLTRLAEPIATGAESARGMAMPPDGRFLFVSHGDPLGTAQDWLTRFAVYGDGTLKQLGDRIPIGTAGGAMAVTPDGRFLYVPCSGSQEVFGFRIEPDGELTPVPGSRFDAPDVPIAAVATPDGRHLYVADGGLIASTSQLVSAYRIKDNGALVRLGDFTAGRAPVALTPTPNGEHLYVSNINSWDVAGFRIEKDGQLETVEGSPFPTGGRQPAFQSIVVKPNLGPVAQFSAYPTPAGRPATFDATGSRDPDGRIARYDWDFGDGTVLQNGGATPAHVYQQAGTYHVRLTVTDNENCSAKLVYTGTSVLCAGSAAAMRNETIVVPRTSA